LYVKPAINRLFVSCANRLYLEAIWQGGATDRL
jgi:hypothetical protein